jgi:hypothetical protein
MRAAILLLSVVVLLLPAGHGENDRPVIAGLKPSPPRDEWSSYGNGGVLFFGPNQWLAYVRVKGEHESVVTRFPDGRVEESEAWDSVTGLRISPDGRTLTYIGARDGRSRFVVNGEPGPAFSHISDHIGTAFSDDGKHWAYVAVRDDDQWVVVHDGIEDPFEVSLSVSPFFSPRSGKIFYPAQNFVVVDGKPGKEYGGGIVGPIQLKPDTEEPIYIASTGPQKRFLVVGGREGRTYDNVSSPRVSDDGRIIAYVADRGRQRFVVINDREFGPYDGCAVASPLVMDPDGRRVAYPGGDPASAGAKAACRVIVDGVPSSQAYEHIANVQLSPPGAPRPRIAFIAVRDWLEDSRKAVIVDGVMGTEYKDVHGLVFSASGDIFYVAEEGGKQFPVHERVAGPGFDEIKALTSTDDGSVIMFTISNDRKAIAFNGIRDGKAHLVHWTGTAWKESAPYDSIDRLISFDASGNAVYSATRKGKQFVVVGDKEQTPYDAIHDVRVGLDGRGVLAVASVGNRTLLVLDGQEVAEEEGIGVYGTPLKHRLTEGRWETQVTAGRVNSFTTRDGIFHLQLSDRTIYTFDNPTGGGPQVIFQGKVKDADAILLTEYHGDGCPEMHRLIGIDRAGEPFVSEPFGGCHGDPDIQKFEDRIEMTYDGEPGQPDKRWVYRPGGSFTQESFKRPGRRNTQDLAKTDAIAVSWGPQLEFFMERNLEILSWDDAQHVLMNLDLKGGKQYHSGWLTIFLDDGRGFLTKPPDINFIVEFAKQHDGFGVE